MIRASNSKKGRGLGISAIALMCCMISDAAFAQTAPPPAPAPAWDGSDDIVVTAQKRVERLQDVPMAVIAVSSADLLSRNQTRIDSYLATTPGISLQSAGNGQTVVSIRGISTGDASNPSVGITIDDVPFGSSTVLGYGMRTLPDIDPANISQVEVLKGPQGTLYGASSVGGLIKFVTAEPSTTAFKGRFDTSVAAVEGGDVGYGVRGSLNIPVSTTFAVNASGFFREDPGYIDNVATGRDNINKQRFAGGHLSALFKPADDFSVRLDGMLQHQQGYGSSSTDVDYLLVQKVGDLKQTDLINTGVSTVDAKLVWGTIKYDLAGLQLNSVTSYGYTRYTGSVDIGTSYGNYATLFYGPAYTRGRLDNYFSTKKFTQEARIGSARDHFLSFDAGGFYTREVSVGQQGIPGVNPTNGAVGGTLYVSRFPFTYRELAGFGDLTFKFTPKFEIQLGGRYSHIKQHYTGVSNGDLYDNTPTPDTPIDASSNAFTYLATARYRFNSAITGYIRLASGYRAGGPNPSATNFGYNATYGPDKTNNYEIGLKGGVLDGLIHFDVSGYYIAWKDIQITLRDPTSGFNFFANGGTAESKGIDGSMTIVPAQGLSVAAGASYNDARLTSDLPVNLAYAFSGDRLPFSAPFGATVSADQKFTLGGGMTGAVGLTYNHVGNRYGNFVPTANAVRTRLPSYDTLDARASFTYEDWTLSLFAQNLTDKRGVIGIIRSGVTGLQTAASSFDANYVRPRSYGLSIAEAF